MSEHLSLALRISAAKTSNFRKISFQSFEEGTEGFLEFAAFDKRLTMSYPTDDAGKLSLVVRSFPFRVFPGERFKQRLGIAPLAIEDVEQAIATSEDRNGGPQILLAGQAIQVKNLGRVVRAAISRTYAPPPPGPKLQLLEHGPLNADGSRVGQRVLGPRSWQVP